MLQLLRQGHELLPADVNCSGRAARGACFSVRNSIKTTAISFALHLLFFLLGIVLPGVLFLASYRRRAGGRTLHWTQRMKTHLYYGNGLLLWGLAGLVIGVWWLSGRPLTDIGLGWGAAPYDLAAVLVLAGFVLVYLFDILREAGSAEQREATRQEFARLGFMPATATQFLNFTFLAVAAGVGEEIVYRGFMVTYLREVLGTSPAAVVASLVLPALAFGLGHFYQGGRAVLKIVVMAILFGFFFLRTQTLWPLMLLHTAIDVFGGLTSWYLQAGEDQRAV
ncbi:CPBP family intramembrane metalloprotease [Neolewinella lacunae]|uniref:CPBP family intramembrane metalloprotease n=1 Tax=Neolewinella lacunae TaxID=1517758 RepID=A0A923PIA5_9BACT|nr:CPBP family intramembrane glutamic endopeptidase [Neolewinella lacunae]MBC6994590.1 CPBP family intramembrane metalloprotease [Neolewinella lacunae]MDN3634462.1 CPBP family intramembrane metalloprotease [Neolewinella lacunae]